MAEQVQAILDSMVEPLKDLMDRQIFTETEIQAIVQRRRESEYLLRRRVARKADFLRYIEAEELLEELRKVRTLQKQRDHRKHNGDKDDDLDDDDDPRNNKKQEKHIGDIHILQLIHLLLTRAIRKFRSDLSLHLLHVDVCKRHFSWNKLSRVYAEALQVFPRQEGLWIEAASHEFFQGPRRSIRNARILLQRGIRKLGKHSQTIWVEYFNLELHFAQTLKGRRKILIPDGNRIGGSSDSEQIQEKNDDDNQSDKDVIDDGEDDTNEMQTALERSSSSMGGDELDDYKIATIVYKNAIQSIPNSIEFRLRFLDILRKFPDTRSFMNSIQKQIQDDFGSHQPEAWIARAVYEAEQTETATTATRPSKKQKTKDPVVAVLEEGMIAVDTYEMKLHAFRFAMRYSFEQEEQGNREAVKQSQELAASIIKDCQGQAVSPDLALEQVEYYLANGETKQAIDVLGTFCKSSKGAAPSSLWIRWASLFEEKDRSMAKQVLKRGLGQISLGTPDYMSILLQYFGCLIKEKEPDMAVLNDTFQQILLLAPTAWEIDLEDVSTYWFGMRCLAHAYLEYLKLALVEKATASFCPRMARKIYESVLLRSSIRLSDDSPNFVYLRSFVDTALQFEAETAKNKPQLCRLYEKVIEIFQGSALENHYRQRRNDGAVYSVRIR